MGTVTSLLVLASLLSSINMSLPKTSYFKYIDVWFLWYLFNIFLLIVYHILLDFGNSTIKEGNQTNRKVTNTFPIKIRIGKKRKIQSMGELSDGFDSAFGIENSNEKSSSSMKNKINNLAMIFFPIIMFWFNVVYFIITT